MSWNEGDWVVRREVLASGPWFGTFAKIIEDTPEQLVSYIPEGSPFSFPPGDWPITGGKNPWSDRPCWQGHGCLMIQRPQEAHAIWHFWEGQQRTFQCWYINIQEPFRRTGIGYDTQDLELDLVVYPDDRWEMKDDELMDLRVREGRWSTEQVADIRHYGATLAARLAAGERWWSRDWQHWTPDPNWQVPPRLPSGWDQLARRSSS